VVVEIGLADAYHGVAFGDQGSTDHQFHAVWGLRWFERDGDAQASEDAPRMLFKGVRFQDETQRKRTLEGLRELDLGSVWFKLCREGLIKLARGVADQLHSQDQPQTGIVQRDQTVAWSGQPPSAGTRLTRRRAKGKVFNASGAPLGTYFSRKETLALDQLGRCDPGDELTFDAHSAGPLVGLLPLDLEPQGPGFLRPEWARARLAELLLKAKPMALTFINSVNDSNWGPEGRYLRLKVDTFSIAPQGDLLNLGAAWRFRYYQGPFDPTTEPVSKLGFQRNAPLPSGRPYQPDDLGGAALEFQRTSLEELLRRANTHGLLEALTKE
jgi:hypothetical protein